jgi:lipid A disaccharide synthetase
MTATPASDDPRIFLSAGEASGDAYGAALIAALRPSLPAATFTGLGGTQMAAAGQHRIVRAEDVAHMGITEVLLHAPFIYRQYRKLVRSIQTSRPTVAVLIDFPDVNFRLAKHLARAGVPVVWFVSPQLWAWKRSRLRWVQQRVDKMLVIFPFEEPFYQARGVAAEFVGHPLASFDGRTHSNSERQRILADIHSVVEAARMPGHAPQKAVLGAIEPWLAEAAAMCRLDLKDYQHVMDGSAVRHVLNRHGNAAMEASRGQLPIGSADFDKVLDVIRLPDLVVLGTKTKGKRDQIGYIKRFEDDTTLYLEETRTGKKALATVSMRKYPAARDFDTITGTLPSNARSDGGNSHILVHPPHTHKNLQKHHPFEQSHSTTRDRFAAQHNLDPARTWIALLPGSRWKEIRANLPTLHELAVRDLIASSAAHTTFDGQTTTAPNDPAAHTRYEFLIPVASTIDASELRGYIAELDAQNLRYLTDEPSSTSPLASRITLVPDAREALYHARASVVASGTATVLAALVGNPFLVVYRVSALTFALAKKLVAYPEEIPAPLDQHGNLPVAMVNLIAGRRIVPELLQGQFTAENVAAELAQIISDTPARAAQIAALAEVHTRLAAPGAPIARVAAAVLSFVT